MPNFASHLDLVTFLFPFKTLLYFNCYSFYTLCLSSFHHFNAINKFLFWQFEMKPTRSDSTKCKTEKVASGNRISDNISSDQKGIGCYSLVAYQSTSKHLEKIQSTMASKEKVLTETALKVLMRRRDKLVYLCLLNILNKFCQ